MVLSPPSEIEYSNPLVLFFKACLLDNVILPPGICEAISVDVLTTIFKVPVALILLPGI